MRQQNVPGVQVPIASEYSHHRHWKTKEVAWGGDYRSKEWVSTGAQSAVHSDYQHSKRLQNPEESAEIKHSDFEFKDSLHITEESGTEVGTAIGREEEENTIGEQTFSDQDMAERLKDKNTSASEVDDMLSAPDQYELEANEICESLRDRYEDLDVVEGDPLEILNLYHAQEIAIEQSNDACAEDLREELDTVSEQLRISTEGQGDLTIQEAKNAFKTYRESLYEATEEAYGDPSESPYEEGVKAHLRVYLRSLVSKLDRDQIS